MGRQLTRHGQDPPMALAGFLVAISIVLMVALFLISADGGDSYSEYPDRLPEAVEKCGYGMDEITHLEDEDYTYRYYSGTEVDVWVFRTPDGPLEFRDSGAGIVFCPDGTSYSQNQGE